MITIILAAGLGTRMRSRVPKVLHHLAGRPLLDYPIALARRVGSRRTVVVVGRQQPEVRDYLRKTHPEVEVVIQASPRGSGDAVRAALPFLRGSGGALILCGDVPLPRPETLRRLKRARGRASLAMVTSRLSDPSGYGRIVRDKGRAVSIVEHSDATAAERRISEINAGIYLADARWLARSLSSLRKSPGGEVYLTDVVAMAAKRGGVPTVEAEEDEIIGVNDRAQLARAERVLRRRKIAALTAAGVTVRDPETAFIDPSVRVGADTEIHPYVHLRGATVIGRGCVIESGCVVVDSRVEDEARLLPYTVVTESRIGKGARLGPFSHVRPATVLGPGVHLGNFVETKKSRLAAGVKANHLTYLGDARIGPGSNIGAGTITCNYDGQAKYVTTIGEKVFVGSDTQFVAPVRIGRGSYIGAGSTITKNVPPGALALSRQPQVNVKGWVERQAQKRAKKLAEQKRRR